MEQRGRYFEIKGVKFYLGNFTPRNNEYEKGLKYRLFVVNYDGYKHPTDCVFCTLKDGKEYARHNYFIWK